MSLSRSPIPEGELATVDLFAPAMEHLIDAAQRGVLFLDVMRRRGNQYREHLAETAPHVLNYEVELVVDVLHNVVGLRFSEFWTNQAARRRAAAMPAA